MNVARWERLEAGLRTRCAAAKVGMAFDVSAPFEKARPLHTPVANLVPDTTAILALGKVIEALNLRQLASAATRGFSF
jgi:hypothetical protein